MSFHVLRKSRIVLTGAPGTGKTSIIEVLENKGFNVIPEPARTVINSYRKYSPELLPHLSIENRERFQLIIQNEAIKNFDDNTSGIFDRSIIDEVGYRNLHKMDISKELKEAAITKRYDKVFIFPIWQEIFRNDDVRSETLEEATIFATEGGFIVRIVEKDGNSFMLEHDAKSNRLNFRLRNDIVIDVYGG
jgi:predicted ATPase